MFSIAEIKSALTPGDLKLIIDIALFASCVNDSGEKSLEKAVRKCLKKI